MSVDVSIVSRLGSETIHMTGTATIARETSYEDSGTQVIDTEIVALSLTGQSGTGTVTATQSATNGSLGQIRGTGPAPSQFPAESFFDVFVDIEIPGSPSSPIEVHNDLGFHLATTEDVTTWPPYGAVYDLFVPGVTPSPTPTGTLPPTPEGTPDCTNGVPLLPVLPGAICVTDMTAVLHNGPAPTVTNTVSQTATPSRTPTATRTPTRTPTATETPAAPTDTATASATETATSTPSATITPPPTETSTLTSTPTPRPDGNANCIDGVNAVDAVVVLQLAAGLIGSVNCPHLADVNGDGRIDALDALLVLQFIAGLLDGLPV